MKNKVLIAGGIVAVGGLLIYFGLKANEVKAAEATTTTESKPALKPTTTSTIAKGTSDVAQVTKFKDYLRKQII
jgi:hypothetical protein